MAFKVLCVASSDKVFDFVKRNLSTFECEVIKATSIALGLFLAQKNYPCLILSQIQLSDGNGIELFHEVKAEPELKDIPFIFFADAKAVVPPTAAPTLPFPISQAKFLAEIVPYLKNQDDFRDKETSE